MADWQDIARAPVEHMARFLAYAKPRSGYEPTVYEVWRFNDRHGCELRLGDGYGSPNERDVLNRLTHWLPLPTPPETNA